MFATQLKELESRCADIAQICRRVSAFNMCESQPHPCKILSSFLFNFVLHQLSLCYANKVEIIPRM